MYFVVIHILYYSTTSVVHGSISVITASIVIIIVTTCEVVLAAVSQQILILQGNNHNEPDTTFSGSSKSKYPLFLTISLTRPTWSSAAKTFWCACATCSWLYSSRSISLCTTWFARTLSVTRIRQSTRAVAKRSWASVMLCGAGIVSIAAGYWQKVKDVRKKWGKK